MDGKNIAKILYIAKKGREGYDHAIEQCAKKLGISKQEVDVLLFLEYHESCDRACDMVEDRGFSKAYVSKAISRLIEKGLVSVETDKKDRRYQHVILNEESKKIISDMKCIEQEASQKLMEGVSKEELKNFMNVIEKMVSNIKKDRSEQDV